MTATQPAIRDALTPDDIREARALFVEYAQWLAVDLCFQGFADELATLPGAYAPPDGRLLLAGPPGQAFGCIALRPLAASKECGRDGSLQLPARVGEVKRLFVRESQRRGGWGRRLAEAIIAEAGTVGYRELKLDTLDWMADARRLYAELGFRECPPYYLNPLPGVVYMSLAL
jgi:GNAT superfamily N-acetyltransferase